MVAEGMANPEQTLAGKVALVTGSGRGIGGAIAVAFKIRLTTTDGRC